jgi:hypothetical protein
MFHADKDTAWSEFSGLECRAGAYALENKVSAAEIGLGDETGLSTPCGSRLKQMSAYF